MWLQCSTFTRARARHARTRRHARTHALTHRTHNPIIPPSATLTCANMCITNRPQLNLDAQQACTSGSGVTFVKTDCPNSWHGGQFAPNVPSKTGFVALNAAVEDAAKRKRALSISRLFLQAGLEPAQQEEEAGLAQGKLRRQLRTGRALLALVLSGGASACAGSSLARDIVRSSEDRKSCAGVSRERDT